MYNSFAYIYDKLMYDVDYEQWADYIEKILKKNGIDKGLILDLGCGTGSFTINMAKRSYDMIGIDISADMLSCAKSKSIEEGLDILFLNQDMTEFELYGTVDAVISLMDSINYITDKNQIKKVFKLVKNYLNPGGVFIFDINTSYKLREVVGNNVFYDLGDDISYIWRNSYDRKRAICEFDLTFFVKEGECYKRFDEIHHERAYSIDEIKVLVENSGLTVLNIYDALNFKPPFAESERVFFVCRKK